MSCLSPVIQWKNIMYEPKPGLFFYGLLAVLGTVFANVAVGDTRDNVLGNGGCSRQHPTEMQTLHVPSGGLQRAILVYVPASHDGRHRLPLVLDLHGSGSTAAEQL